MNTTNVPASRSSFRNVPIADSGSRMPEHIKEADRNQKFKFFECLQALMKGRLPTNEQIDHFLVMAQNSPSLESRAHMLSADGRALYRDFQELLRVTRGIVYEKNEQELFQNFIYHCTQATDSVSQDVQAPNLGVGVSTRKAKKEGKDTLGNMVAVAKMVTTNPEFRFILNELFQLASEIFSEGADKVAHNAQAAGDRLSAAAGDYSQSTAEASQAGGYRLQQNIREVTDRVQNIADQSKVDPVLAAQNTRDDIGQQGNYAMDEARRQAANLKQSFNQSGQGFKANAQSKARDLQENIVDYANTKMPPERRSALIERFKVLLGQIQADPQYQKAIDSIMNLFGTWRQRAKQPTSNITNEAGKVTSDPNVETAIIEFKVILQRWAQGYSLDPIIAIIHNVWQRTMVDPELRLNYVTSETINDDASVLMDQGRSLMSVKYKADTEALLQEGKMFIEKLNNDAKSREVATTFQKFANDLFYDKHGKLKFKPHLFDDFRYVLVPSMLESFQFIPIPRIEYSDLKVDLMFDNMILTSTDLLPRLLEISMNNTIRMVPRGNTNRSLDTNKHDFNMLIQGLEANIRNVDYYVKTKEGFRFQDRGIADVLINGKGMDIRVRGRKTLEDSQKPSLITFEEVKVKIHTLAIKMRKSSHPVMYSFAQPFIKTVVKNAIAHALETQIKEGLTSGDKTVATSIRDTRIRTGKNTLGALVDSASSFVSNKVSPDEKLKARNERKKNAGHYNRTSRVIFDEDGLCVLDPVKHMELKVGQPLREDANGMANMPSAPWVSTAFDLPDMKMKEHEQLPGMRRTQGTVAM
ncbi:hypothetical protein BGZ65_011666 [Modicella reniformis]|uniref:Uncharacterized protein n=1 Tax=Modicella reniformis TaxID=1440133 RepID=A0A9P6MAC5_9FUNG|nr:hypothetical protein BGZ65_011666 [Modicella reniformis]